LSGYVLDACALIAYLRDEPGGDRVEEILLSGHPVRISAVNLLEVCYDAERRSANPAGALEVLNKTSQLNIEVFWELAPEQLLAASSFKAAGRISLADAIALALAKYFNAPLVTADHHEMDPIEKAGLATFEWLR
jgi:PIN domain nuclease of toxin-antitoxin system